MPCRLLLLAVFVIGAANSHADETASMLAEPEWLATEMHARSIDGRRRASDEQPQSGQTLVLIDVRPLEAKGNARPPETVGIDARAWTKAFGDGTDTGAWTERIGGVLKNKDATVVVFDQQLTPTATRIWWILKYWGVEDVRVLDGGMQAYSQANGVVEVSSRGSTDTPSDFEAVTHPKRLATYEQVLSIASGIDTGVCLVDTRTDREVAAGRIPTSKHLDWQTLVDPDTGKLHDKDQLQQLLAQIGLVGDAAPVTYCRSGGRASVVAFAIEALARQAGRQLLRQLGRLDPPRRRPHPTPRPIGHRPVGTG